MYARDVAHKLSFLQNVKFLNGAITADDKEMDGYSSTGPLQSRATTVPEGIPWRQKTITFFLYGDYISRKRRK